MDQLNRRSLITGLISLVAAPAIVRVSSIMPVKVFEHIEQLPYIGYDWAGTPPVAIGINFAMVTTNEHGKLIYQWLDPKEVYIEDDGRVRIDNTGTVSG